MKTFVFKSSLVITSILLLMSYVGGAPMNAAAAAVALVWSPTTSPGSFDYGTLNAGQTQSQQFMLTDGRNSGLLTASLSGSPAFSITSDGCTGARLRTNQSCAVTVQYAPTGSGQSDTATLNASNRKGSNTSLTLTGSTPCAPLSALISPPGGDKLARTYTITGSDANGCTAPLQYYWQCTSADLTGCANFLSQANAGTYGMPSAPLDIVEFVDYTIVLHICQIGTTNCSALASTTYSGVPA